MELSKDQRKAILVIKQYLNVEGNPKYTDDYILTKYDLAVDELIESATTLKANKLVGAKAMSEGNQSVTFADNIEAWTITDNVKSLLPVPFIRLMG